MSTELSRTMLIAAIVGYNGILVLVASTDMMVNVLELHRGLEGRLLARIQTALIDEVSVLVLLLRDRLRCSIVMHRW